MQKITLCLIFAWYAGLLAGQSVVLDTTFGAGGALQTELLSFAGNPYGTDIAYLPDGNMVIGGQILGVKIYKYDTHGERDTNYFKANFVSAGFEVDLTVQADKKILFTGENQNYTTYLARLDTFGNLDTTFGMGGIVQTFNNYWLFKKIFEQADGKLIISGAKRMGINNIMGSVMRYLPNGQLDTTFAQGGEFILDIPGVYDKESPGMGIEQPDHKLIFAGLIGNQNKFNVLIFRLNPNGMPDSTFGVNGAVIEAFNGSSEPYGLAVQPDGKILISGYSALPFQAIVARYHSDGTRDMAFGNQGVYYYSEAEESVGLVLRPDGRILTANWKLFVNELILAQLLPNGEKDLSFGENGVFIVKEPMLRPRTLILQDNKVVVSGRKTDNKKMLLRFLLDLNVGILDKNPANEPIYWVYPNPVSEQFNVKFGVSKKETVSVSLLDLNGKLIQTWFQNQSFDPGEHVMSLNCPNQLASGNYILTLAIAGKTMRSIKILKK
jgi:uncharacterized delta-60 repeat protein